MNFKMAFLSILLFSFLAKAQQKDVFDVARKGTVSEMETIYKQTPERINTLNEGKSSPLLLACYRGNQEVALYLADKVNDINFNSGMGTPLMAAVMSGNLIILEKLIALHANLNLTDSQGKTALIYASFFNKNDVVKLLLKAGAQTQLKDADGKTALDFAKFNKNTELIILLDN
jgi:ankyrin repeat protein